nr:hypothetical protein KPHV_60400 [Kitasatospora purpeofusca]
MSQPQPDQPAPLDLDAIQARCDAATDGPWTLHDALDGDGFPGHLWVVENPADGPGDHHAMINIGTRDDAEFIARAREDVPALLARVSQLEAERALYVGVEPTIAEEMAELKRGFFAAHEVCDAAEKQALRWEHPLPVPEWVAAVRAALDGHPAS